MRGKGSCGGVVNRGRRDLCCLLLAIAVALAWSASASAWRATHVRGYPGAVSVMRVHGSVDRQQQQFVWFRAGAVYRSPAARNRSQYICVSYVFFGLVNGSWVTSGQRDGPHCAWVAPGYHLIAPGVNYHWAGPQAYRALWVVTWGLANPARLIGSETIDLKNRGDYTCDVGTWGCTVYTKYSPSSGAAVRSWLYFPLF